ncbi:MAG TPA: GatB/YqeY domain-containing protein [Syntrophales bacterium]|nr:GatB/YqeY domain-containing protein [Syntrophales bacterium]HPX10730.1 GatB/YqeY domain-containing protein [Syntrophales bacterium]HQB30090.1 GatB/YqeY domain-containing protein [Syntrophales bacterium]HQN78823.1 GatB/YqeY domain-containing protein [Syntrophales bacterium]HQQ27960.1 GatB/YqeY domain-containing protein [Syntrophales bacterium]
MDIQAKVDQEMIRAAKEKNRERLSALRLMKNALHNREIDVKGRLDEKEALMVFSTMIKQRKDSIEQFRAGRREDLAVKEEAELRVIQEFMPSELSDAEIDECIEKAIAETGAAGAKDMGKVMKQLMPSITGRADGKVVSEKVRKRLTGK